jgi:hypothetical protein
VSTAEHDAEDEDYYRVVASLLEDGGLFVVRDRESPEEAESTFRRKLFDADEDRKPPDAASEFFQLLPGSRALYVRLVGDDSPDWNRIDAMVPIRGRLFILKRRRRPRRPRRLRR